MTEQLRTAASPMCKVDLLTVGLAVIVGRTQARERERNFSVRRRAPFGPLRERFRDGPGRPHAACAQVWVSARFRASTYLSPMIDLGGTSEEVAAQ
jgi:hypothetical protein